MSWDTEDHKHNAYDVYGVAEEHHRHYDLENLIDGFREDLNRAVSRIGDLEDALAEATNRIRALEGSTPQARQLELEADLAAADLAASGYDRHGRGCDCPECYEPEPDEYDPGPEADDEGGMSEDRHAVTREEPW
jgi:hypothetical protein